MRVSLSAFVSKTNVKNLKCRDPGSGVNVDVIVIVIAIVILIVLENRCYD